jgi:hypothetical protein
MRIIKLGLISFVLFVVLVTGISLLFPSHIRISKAINIKADKAAVMAEIKEPSNWHKWYPGLDSAKLFYEMGQVKGVIVDNRDSAHPTLLKIQSIKNDEVTAKFIPRSLRPVDHGWKTLGDANADSITLQWYMDFHLRWYPWEKFSSLLLEKSQGTRMEEGLTRLKAVVQNVP